MMRTAPYRLGVAAVLLLVVVVVSLVAAIGAGGVVQPPFLSSPPQERYYAIGESVTRDGITLELQDVLVTSSETTFRFRLSGPNLHISELTAFVPHQDEISVSGVRNEEAPPLIAWDYGPSGEPLLTATVGSLSAESTRAQLSFATISVHYGRTGIEIYEGPWSFVFEHDGKAVDPLDKTIAVNETKETTTHEIELRTLHLSSSGLQAEYTMDAKTTQLGGSVNWAARLVFPDGTWLPGMPGRGDENKTEGELSAEFQVSNQTGTATLVFGPYREELEGPFSLEIGLPENRPNTGETVLNGSFQLAGDEIEVVSLTSDKSGFTITFLNVTEGRPTVAHDPFAEAEVRDDLGNSYLIDHFGWEYRDDGRGGSIPHLLSVALAAPLDSKAMKLFFVVETLTRFVEGPEFEVTLP